MPLTAMVRNLGKMTNIGLLAPMSDASKKVVETLTNEQALRKARVHPMAILNALKVYNNGGGFRGKLTWTPDQRIVDALDAAFYGSFGNVTPTGKNVMLAIDCSGSMGCNVSGSEVLSCRDAAAAMALITANVESNYEIVGFSNGSGYTVNGGKSRWCTYGSGINTLKISPRMRLDTVVNIMANFSWGGTDCALPMLYATGTKRPVDAFFVYTDNETWAGSIQPAQALVEYRKRSGRAAKLAVVGMAINNFTIADPKDAGMLDVVGFDTATPEVLSEFTRS
jgi:60 kDa SS-A/Ro ribonucleoprotein